MNKDIPFLVDKTSWEQNVCEERWELNLKFIIHLEGSSTSTSFRFHSVFLRDKVNFFFSGSGATISWFTAKELKRNPTLLTFYAVYDDMMTLHESGLARLLFTIRKSTVSKRDREGMTFSSTICDLELWSWICLFVSHFFCTCWGFYEKLDLWVTNCDGVDLSKDLEEILWYYNFDGYQQF